MPNERNRNVRTVSQSKKREVVNNLILSADESLAGRALAEALDEKVDVTFALAWDPPEDSPVFIREVKANGNNNLPSSGAIDQKSPYQLGVGSYAKGSTVKISWVLRTFNDLNGIRAFAKASNATEWTTLDTKSPLANKEEWASTVPYEVPK